MDQETLANILTFYESIMKTNSKYGISNSPNSPNFKWFIVLLIILIGLILISIYLYASINERIIHTNNALKYGLLYNNSDKLFQNSYQYGRILMPNNTQNRQIMYDHIRNSPIIEELY